MNATLDIGTASTTSKLMSPLNYMDPYLSTIQSCFGVIGIPMNLLVCGTIIFTKQLQTTQNLAWLGIGFSNIFWLFELLLEVAAAAEHPSFSLPLFNTIFGLPGASLILNLHLSVLDRRLFVSYTSFYKKYVTNTWILVIQMICFVLLTLLLKGRIFYQTLSISLKQILYEINFGILFSIAFIAFISLFIHYKHFQENKVDKRPVLNSSATYISAPNQSTDEESKSKGTTIGEAAFDKSQATDYIAPNQLPKQAEKHKTNLNNEVLPIPNKNMGFSQSEVQGYYSIKINLKAFFIFAFGSVVFLLLSFLCLLIAVINGSLFDSCSTWFSTSFYLRGILVGFYTAVFNPLCFVGHSHDFAVLGERCNPIGEIARFTRRFTVFNKPITLCDPVTNV